ncbi:MAG TPA: hypothetical protein VKY26_08990 [Actinomycetota bacterium]|nr:hypothetical protein [Actinomycetota bacterium]
MYKDREKQREAVRRYYERNRDIYREKNDRMRAQLRQMVVEAKSVPCMDCGQTYPFYVMDFDHRDRDQKEALISQLVTRISKGRLIAEMAKCDVVCSNCHRIRTYKDGKARDSEYLAGLINADGREGPQLRFRM